ncbi:small archaeal modifier protein 2 [Nanobdella aerobiophila]|uniref:Small archaeal modifier protein 2 n=1 Tax=Nanobdella aerobiophila TaxID=2586965 RepID=A0A915WSW1_9ARCH|nr:MoaD/ThiS family protein [Nanobdella aerobiophila]BBL45715.1 small archaeal modifier protein 2 [Nanobdella aerobiophila]
MKKIKVFIEKYNLEKEIDFNGNNIKELLNMLNLDPSRFLVLKNNEIVTEEDNINEGDYIKILDSVSGG